MSPEHLKSDLPREVPDDESELIVSLEQALARARGEIPGRDEVSAAELPALKQFRTSAAQPAEIVDTSAVMDVLRTAIDRFSTEPQTDAGEWDPALAAVLAPDPVFR